MEIYTVSLHAKEGCKSRLWTNLMDVACTREIIARRRQAQEWEG